ncbi:MAG: PilZ domain-containing protein [Polyangiales bacterium]
MTRIHVSDDGHRGKPADRREYARYPAESIAVDYGDGDTFLFSYLANISEMGIFIRTESPLPIGTVLTLRFGPSEDERLCLEGVVMWVNAARHDGHDLNPGMGIQFVNLTPENRESVVELVRTVAYLVGEPAN